MLAEFVGLSPPMLRMASPQRTLVKEPSVACSALVGPHAAPHMKTAAVGARLEASRPLSLFRLSLPYAACSPTSMRGHPFACAGAAGRPRGAHTMSSLVGVRPEA